MRSTLETLISDYHERGVPDLIRRDLFIVEVDRKAMAVVGMRRSGKTWLCYQRIQELVAGGLPIERTLYINFEDERLLPFATSDFQLILEVYYARFPSFKDKKCHLFLDEIQKIDGWESFVRRILDTENLSVWITGSSAKLLSREIATSLRGRSLTTEVFPLSFREFLAFGGIKVRGGPNFGSRAGSELKHEVGQYLERGGFPEIRKIDDAETRRQVLTGYVDVTLLRDVIERHRVTNATALRSLLRHLMAAPGGRFSINKFYNDLRSRGVQCTKNLLHEYLDHLSDAYLTYPITIHSRSEKARQINPRKIYIIDTGLLNASSFGMTEDRGALLENLVHLHIRRHGIQPEYVVTRSGYEVDFVMPGRKAADRKLIQVCWSLVDQPTRDREVRSLREAMEEMDLDHGTIVTWLDEGSEPGIEIVPAWKWLLEDPRE